MSLRDTRDIGTAKIVMLGGGGGGGSYTAGSGISISNSVITNIRKGALTGVIDSVSSNIAHTQITGARDTFAAGALILLQSEAAGTADNLRIQYGAQPSDSQTFAIYDTSGTAASVTIASGDTVIMMIDNTGYRAIILNVLSASGGSSYAGLGIGKKKTVTNNVIDTDIDLHRAPIVGDRLLVYFDETVQNPTGLKTYNNGVAVTSNLENATPLYLNAGWNILEFKNDGLLYNNVWVRKQNIPVPSTLAGMSDTLIVSPSNDQFLVFDNGRWKNQKYIEANVGFSDTELKKIKVGDIVYDTDGLRDYFITNIANNNITISVLNSNQFVMENISINTGNHSGSSNGWNLVLTDGMNPVSVALKNADGTAFADDIHENELLFVYVDTAGNVARVLEIHSHDVEVLKDICITEKTASGNPITVTDALPYNAVSLSAEIEPIQDLHGYDHPWVGGAGKNKLILDLATIKANNTVGTWNGNVYSIAGGTVEILTDSANNVTGIKVNGTFNSAVQMTIDEYTIPLTANSYIFTCGLNNDGNVGADNNSGIFLSNINGNNSWLLSYADITFRTFTISDPTKLVRCGLYIWEGATVNNLIYYPMIRLSSEQTGFAPWENICPISGRTEAVITRSDGDEISEDFTIQLGTTVYGGSLNVTTGVLTVTYAIVDMGDLTWVYDTEVGRFITEDINSTIKIPVDQFTILSAISSAYRATSFVNLYNQHIDGTFASSSGGNVSIINKRYTDITAFTTAMTGQKICYELATPTTIQLTPEQLTMLKGYNRLSSDGGGDITLTYKADRLAAIEAALAELQNT